MSTDTSDTDVRDTAGIRLVDRERYLLLFRLIGCDTLTQISAETGVGIRQVRRVMNGGPLGEVFMARSITALQRHADTLAAYGHTPPTLDDLFTVTAPSPVPAA